MRTMRVLLAAPRGFCAGVQRAIDCVERALALHGAPVYVRHAIVHNEHAVQTLANKGARFVESLDDVPEGAVVIFSAHGVAQDVRREADARKLAVVDATCPLVAKVHREAQHYHARGFHILLIGHRGHPEVSGTMGQLPAGAIELIETEDDAKRTQPPAGKPLALLTQTTLSVDDARAIRALLAARLGELHTPKQDDICYATTNRQAAVKALAARCDYMLVLGGAHSSNSRRLLETALAAGCARGALIPDAAALAWDELEGVQTLGLSSGASTPEALVQDVLAALAQRFTLAVQEEGDPNEHMHFPLPQTLRATNSPA